MITKLLSRAVLLCAAFLMDRGESLTAQAQNSEAPRRLLKESRVVAGFFLVAFLLYQLTWIVDLLYWSYRINHISRWYGW